MIRQIQRPNTKAAILNEKKKKDKLDFTVFQICSTKDTEGDEKTVYREGGNIFKSDIQ